MMGQWVKGYSTEEYNGRFLSLRLHNFVNY